MKRHIKIILYVIILTFLTVSCSNNSKPNKVIIDCLESVIEISILDIDSSEIVTKGTAVCVEKKLFLTAGHIFTDYNEDKQVILGENIKGDTFYLKLHSISDKWDLSFINSENFEMKPIAISKSDPYWLDDVYFIGNSRGLGLNINKCYVSSPNKIMDIKENQYSMIQINGTVNEGDSGGPLLNTDGELVGIISFKLSTSSGFGISDMSFAVNLQSINEYIAL